MKYRELRFSDFASVQNLIKVQTEFLAFDDSIQEMKDVQMLDNTLSLITYNKYGLMAQPEITFYRRNEFTGTENYEKIKFYEDFLLPKIHTMSDVAFSEFKSEIEEKGIYGNAAQDGFVKHIKGKINQFTEKIEGADYLPKVVKKDLLKELEKYERHLEEYLLDPYPKFKQKIQFNWNRTDVIYFFHLLRENRVIGPIGDSDFGKIIDSVFEYYSCQEETYYVIKNSRKLLNEFHNPHGRSEDKAIERLKGLFKNEDFYNV